MSDGFHPGPHDTVPEGPHSPLATAVLWLVKLYRTVSAGTRAHCRYLPTCSAYADEAVRTHGAMKGGWLALKRISRCHPWGGTGYDPVPGTDPDFERRHPTRRDGHSPSDLTTKAS